MDTEDLAAFVMIGGIVALPFAVSNLVPGDEIGLVLLMALAGIVLINQDGGMFKFRNLELSS